MGYKSKGCDTATLTITVTGTNDAPVISDVVDFGFTEAADASAQDLSISGTISFDADTPSQPPGSTASCLTIQRRNRFIRLQALPRSAIGTR